MKSLVVGGDNKNYGEIHSTGKKNISRLSAAGSKKTPLCYSKVKTVAVKMQAAAIYFLNMQLICRQLTCINSIYCHMPEKESRTLLAWSKWMNFHCLKKAVRIGFDNCLFVRPSVCPRLV